MPRLLDVQSMGHRGCGQLRERSLLEAFSRGPPLKKSPINYRRVYSLLLLDDSVCFWPTATVSGSKSKDLLNEGPFRGPGAP